MQYDLAISKASLQISQQWTRQRLSQTPTKLEKGSTGGMVATHLAEIRRLFGTARKLLRQMGVAAGVEIEPAQQTLLVDRTEALPGVLCAGVPGAGGHDAVFAITLSLAARKKVEVMWSEWEVNTPELHAGSAVSPLLLKADGGVKAGVRPEFDQPW